MCQKFFFYIQRIFNHLWRTQQKNWSHIIQSILKVVYIMRTQNCIIFFFKIIVKLVLKIVCFWKVPQTNVLITVIKNLAWHPFLLYFAKYHNFLAISSKTCLSHWVSAANKTLGGPQKSSVGKNAKKEWHGKFENHSTKKISLGYLLVSF